MCWGWGRGATSVWGHSLLSCTERGPANTGTRSKHQRWLSQSTQTFHGPVPMVMDLEPWRGHRQRSAEKELVLVVHTFTELWSKHWSKMKHKAIDDLQESSQRPSLFLLSLPYSCPHTSRWWLSSRLQAVQGILVSGCSAAWSQQKCSWFVSNMEEILHPSGSKQEKKQIKCSYNISCEGSRANIVAGSWPAAFI